MFFSENWITGYVCLRIIFGELFSDILTLLSRFLYIIYTFYPDKKQKEKLSVFNTVWIIQICFFP